MKETSRNGMNSRPAGIRAFAPDKWDVLALVLILLAVTLFFAGYARQLFQTDTYAKWFYSIAAYRGQYKINARYGEWLYMEFFYRLMGEPQHFRAFHVCVAMGLDAAIVFVLWKVICRGCRAVTPGLRMAALLPAILLRANVFFADIFQFGVDAAPMFIGDLFAVAGGIVITGGCEAAGSSGADSGSGRGRLRRFIIGTACLMISLFFRQTCVVWFLLTALLRIFFETADDGRALPFVKKAARLVISGAIAILPSLFAINVIAPSDSRGSFSQIDLSASARALGTTLKALLYNCDGVRPKGLYTALLLIVLAVSLALHAAASRKAGTLLLKEAAVTAGLLIGTFFPVLFQTYMPHRITFGFACILPLWAILALRCRALWLRTAGRMKRFLPAAVLCAMLVILAADLSASAKIRQGMIETNRIDREDALAYYRLIQDYEESTGITVTKVAWHYDMYFTWTLPGVIHAGALNDRAYCAAWSRREIFPYAVGRRFEIVPFGEDLYERYFADRNWDSFDREQVMIIGDTAYIVLY